MTNKDMKETSGSKIAKNTLALYARTLFMMFITLYTSRVILDALGISDYGIYNVVAGFVSLFFMISAPLSQAISRFLTYELGRGDAYRLRCVFSTSINIQLALSLLLILLGETIGLWFLYHELVIPEGRMDAAFWVFQCALAETTLYLLNIPYNGVIVSHERMSVFAYISIIEGILKLLIVFLLYKSPFDKLIVYAVLLVLVSILLRAIYMVYCNRHFKETHYAFVFDKELFKEMTSYAGWNFLTYGAVMLNMQGVNILFNQFFGVTANAARGIATRVETAVARFANDFTTAMNPQIIKRYAVGDLTEMETLVSKGAKLSFFLMLFFSIPLAFETNAILNLWLVEVPENTALFVRLSVIGSCLTIISNTSSTAIHATGRIRTYSIINTLVVALVFPGSWLAYKMGAPIETTYYLYIFFYALSFFVHLFIMKRLIGFHIALFMKAVMFKVVIVTILALVVPSVICTLFEAGILRMIINFILTTLSTSLIVYYVGLVPEEQSMALNMIRSKLKK